MALKPPASRTFVTTIAADPDGSSMTAITVPFDPREVFGKVRAPVVVSIGAHSFRSTVCSMGGGVWVPLRRSNREAAGVSAGQRVRVTLALDDEPRTVAPPRDLATALKAAGLLKAWRAMSFTHQREHAEAVEGAKKPETRAKRIAACVEMVSARAAKMTGGAAPAKRKKPVAKPSASGGRRAGPRSPRRRTPAR